VFIGHKASHVPKDAIVVYSSGIEETNPEYQKAKAGNILLHRSQMLSELMKGSLPLLVTGTHGKTTTSSLLAHVLVSAGERPSYCVGGVVESLQSGAGHGTGEWFVAEADESDGSFLAYVAKGAIITNIGVDHLSYWKSEKNLIEGFKEFQKRVLDKDLLFFCIDSPILKELSKEGVSYGFSSDADLRIDNVSYLGWNSCFDLHFKGKTYAGVEIPMIGPHSILNAAAVFGLCLQLGVEQSLIYKGLKSFLGTKRRTEKKGDVGGVTVYDDYAHHPTEIMTTLAAIKKAAGGRRIVVLFQPHKYSRVADCFKDFGPALALADQVLLTDIYEGGEKPIEGIDSKALLAHIEKEGSSHFSYYPKEELLEATLASIQGGDIVVTMGAGDITSMGSEILRKLIAWQ
jgi:UDP-N-acetylmuramate--alanine ligase